MTSDTMDKARLRHVVDLVRRNLGERGSPVLAEGEGDWVMSADGVIDVPPGRDDVSWT